MLRASPPRSRKFPASASRGAKATACNTPSTTGHRPGGLGQSVRASSGPVTSSSEDRDLPSQSSAPRPFPGRMAGKAVSMISAPVSCPRGDGEGDGIGGDDAGDDQTSCRSAWWFLFGGAWMDRDAAVFRTGGGGQVGLGLQDRLRRAGSADGQDAGGQQPGVATAADRRRWPRYARRHLHDRQQRVEAVEIAQRTGTPITGSGVTEASMPGRCAAPPAPAMMTCSPRGGRSSRRRPCRGVSGAPRRRASRGGSRAPRARRRLGASSPGPSRCPSPRDPAALHTTLLGRPSSSAAASQGARRAAAASRPHAVT